MKTRILLLSLLFSGLGFSQTLELTEFADGFENPAEIASAGDARLFVVEQTGHIRILNADGSVNGNDYLDISSLVTFSGEQGLLGLAFHPDYINNGYFFVHYVNTSGNVVIARYSRMTNTPDMADPASALIMLTIDHPLDNHNGGCLKFGPDGYLYVAIGDGGGGGDPENRAQNTEVLLGKLLRLDVNAPAPYIPEGNPFTETDGADEIWAYGLRNPWKFSFDRLTDELWIADVGQGNVEEINRVQPDAAGVNYGWKCYEGNAEFDTSQCSDIGVYTMPIAQYVHEGTSRCSITGGYVYTGETYTNMQNKYFFADFCTGEIGMANTQGEITWLGDFGGNFTTFGEDADGELYIADTAGSVYKITDTSVAGTNDFAANLFSLYPNPATNELFINVKDATDGTAGIYDIRGQLVLEQPLKGTASRIDTSRLQSGVYIVSLETQGAKATKKLIIN